MRVVWVTALLEPSAWLVVVVGLRIVGQLAQGNFSLHFVLVAWSLIVPPAMCLLETT